MGILAVSIDTREPKWVQDLQFGGAPKIITAHDCGDVWVATDDMHNLVIERKTPDDFVNSIMDQGVFLQAMRMQQMREETGSIPFVMITGQILRNSDGTVFSTLERKFIWNAVQGAKLSIQEMGVLVVECANDTDFEAAVMRLAERSRAEAIKLLPFRKVTILGGGATLLCGLPGIGVDNAGKVLDYCGSAGHALAELSLSEKDSTIKIPGIGPGMRNNIRWAMGLEDDEILAVLPKSYLSETP